MAKIISQDVTVELEEGDFQDIIDIAGYGINYWCYKANVYPNKYIVFWYDEDFSDSGNPDWPRSKKQVAVVSPKMIEQAWARILNEKLCADYILEYFRSGDVGDIDATAGDVLIQVTIFGEIIYG